MKYAHSLKIVHRNLKPSNIFINSDLTIKISDFGISNMMIPKDQLSLIDPEDTKLFFFIAPEMKNDNYNEKVDVFSFGALIYYILNLGDIPKITVFDYIQCKTFEIPKTFTKFSRELIESCMNQDPNSRPEFSTICDMIYKNMYDLVDLPETEKHDLMQRMIKIKEKSSLNQ